MVLEGVYQIWDIIFKDISSSTQGAGFSLEQTGTNISLRRTNFINCVTTSGYGGGGFYANVNAVEAICINFEECKAPDNGCAFRILPICLNTTILFTLITKINFNQDGFYRSGSFIDIIQDSNATEFYGSVYAFTFGSSSQATVYYKFFNSINNGATSSGLFYSTSKILFASANIINCNSINFINFPAPEGSLLSLTNSVISECNFGTTLSVGNKPLLEIYNNIYSSNTLMSLFGKNSSIVQAKPNTLIFKFPICYPVTYKECSPGKRSKSFVIFFAVNLSC